MDAYQVARPPRGVGRTSHLISCHKSPRALDERMPRRASVHFAGYSTVRKQRRLDPNAAMRLRASRHRRTAGFSTRSSPRLNDQDPVSRYNDVTMLSGPDNGTICHGHGRIRPCFCTSFDQIANSVAGIGDALCPNTNAHDKAYQEDDELHCLVPGNGVLLAVAEFAFQHRRPYCLADARQLACPCSRGHQASPHSLQFVANCLSSRETAADIACTASSQTMRPWQEGLCGFGTAFFQQASRRRLL